MLVWTLVLLSLAPNDPPASSPILLQRHFATALACERSASDVALPASLRLVCLPAEGTPGMALAAAY